MKPLLKIVSVIIAIIGLAMTMTSAQADLLEDLENRFVELNAKMGPCVVNIQTEGAATQMPEGMDELRRFFGQQMPENHPQMNQRRPVPRGMGSGFIYDASGHIITNNHVVEDAKEITVRLWNGHEYEAEIVGRDPEADLAVIKIEADETLQVASLGNSDDLKVGQFAIAIGSPRGFESTFSYGHISALGRNQLYGLSAQGLKFQNLIQTDAAINLGNSGGPVCNIKGEVIGISVAIVAGANSIGFAIPINMAKTFVPQIIDTGKVTRGFLGMSIDDVTPHIAEALDLKAEHGAMAVVVFPDTPAANAGLQPYDIVLTVNGAQIENASDLMHTISSYAPGNEVELEVWRNAEMVTLTVVLMERPVNGMASVPEEKELVYGMQLRELTPELKERIGFKADAVGVLIEEVEPGSPADDARLSRGDLITEVAQQPVTTPGEVLDIFQRESESKKSILIQYVRGEQTADITVLRLPKK